MNSSVVPGHAVYVLGAGSSKDAGYPIVRDFFSEDYIQHIIGGLTDPSYADDLGHWRTWFERERRHFTAFGVDAETLFSRFHDDADHANYSRLRTYMAALLYVAREYGMHASHTSYSNAFASRLFAHERASIITFNYDLLIDRALKVLEIQTRRQAPQAPPVFDYGFAQEAAKSPVPSPDALWFLPVDPVLPPYDGLVPYLKLHGSLNWGRCQQCSTVTIFPTELLVFEGHELGGPHVCETCGNGSVEPLLLPPSKEKKIQELEMLWKKAHLLLAEADYVVFVGYSLPEYDMEAYSMFRSTCSPSSKRQPKIIVVDKYLSEATERRFRSVSANCVFQRSGFAYWIS